ncbi:MAG: hypothetical protein ACLUN5_11520 [Oscillospiraceae bacterium]
MEMEMEMETVGRIFTGGGNDFTMSGVPASAVEAGVSAVSGNAAADDGTISGDVTWNNQTITTPVVVTGRHNNHAERQEYHYDYRDRLYRRSEYVFRQSDHSGKRQSDGQCSEGKDGIEDGSWSDTAGGTLTIKDGAKITTNGGHETA